MDESQIVPKPRQLQTAQVALASLRETTDAIPRFRHQLGVVALKRLTASVRDFGLLTPPLVWQLPGADDYLILDGCRRVAVMRDLGWDDKVTCTVFEGVKDDALALSLIARLNHSAAEECNHGDEIVGVVALLETGVLGKQVKVAAALGRTQGWVSQAKMIRDRLSPDAMLALREGRISRRTAFTFVWKKGRSPLWLDHAQQAAELAALGARVEAGTQPRRGRPWPPKPALSEA